MSLSARLGAFTLFVVIHFSVSLVVVLFSPFNIHGKKTFRNPSISFIPLQCGVTTHFLWTRMTIGKMNHDKPNSTELEKGKVQHSM
tara:strand:+ start:14254 stop:14511 length:258 start_codon:yes stop_codon:yes gene_type:complete